MHLKCARCDSKILLYIMLDICIRRRCMSISAYLLVRSLLYSESEIVAIGNCQRYKMGLFRGRMHQFIAQLQAEWVQKC